jgi:hypothetical protein
MTMLLSPVPAPPIQPPRVSLLTAAQLITDGADSGDRWGQGYTFVPEGNTAGGGVADPCSGAFTSTRPPDVVEAEPFYVWEGDECSRLSRTYDDVLARARRNLQGSESYHIAREFWRGDLATTEGWTNQPVLARADSDTLTNGPAQPLDALACLEQGLATAQRGRRGMIHATHALATYWQSLYLLHTEGTNLLTALGTIVVVDAGYDGSGPLGQAAVDGSQWAYATGLVQVRLGPVGTMPDTEGQALDRLDNTVTAYASRLASPSWDGMAHLAAEVDVPFCWVGPPS